MSSSNNFSKGTDSVENLVNGSPLPSGISKYNPHLVAFCEDDIFFSLSDFSVFFVSVHMTWMGFTIEHPA
jgi:hypothetical protein